MAIANGSFGFCVLRHSDKPSAEIRHRRFVKASRKEGAFIDSGRFLKAP
jgi:hypothetical protein